MSKYIKPLGNPLDSVDYQDRIKLKNIKIKTKEDKLAIAIIIGYVVIILTIAIFCGM